MENIRILVYADDENFTPEPGSLKGGLADLVRFTKEKTKHIANVTFCFLQRHGPDEYGKEVTGKNKLTFELLKQFEEVWFFGVRQVDTETQPNNELTQEEVDVLQDWMRAGGVFLTGDHCSSDPTLPGSDCDEKGHASFLGLGRALGQRIPRAGQLRIWKGPPTDCPGGELSERDNFNTNTQDEFDPCKLDDPLLESDEIPQTLHLIRTGCFPHRLFWFEDEDRDVIEITKLPDHRHEGEVVVPKNLDDEWHVRSPPPKIIAKGRDKRFPLEQRLRGLIAAYDGYEDEDHPERSAGRIVADSSFHHYLDINLRKLRARDAAGLPVAGSDLDQIANFYGNLAWWLAPTAARLRTKWDLLFRVATHIDVLEEMRNSTELIGKTANAVLTANIGRSNLTMLYAPSEFERFDSSDELLSFIFLGRTSLLSLPVQRPDFFLGAAIKICHEYYTVNRYENFFRDAELFSTLENRIRTMVTDHLKISLTSFDKTAFK